MIRKSLIRWSRFLVPLFAVWGLSTQCMAHDNDLKAGVACEFEIFIDVTDGGNRIMRTFYDKNENPVRYLNAGKGAQYLFTNPANGITLSVKTGGSVEHKTPNGDGTETWVTTGHELIILFPTDLPAGPASILYIGRLVLVIEPNTNTFLGFRSFTGKSIDICAALAG